MISLGLLFAVLASVGYGLSDVLSGIVVRRHSTTALALAAQATGLAVLVTAAALRRPELSGPGVLWGLGAGVVGAVGVLAFYTALQRGHTSVVTPVAGAGVVLPVLAGVLHGDPLDWRAALGVAAVVVGIVVVAAADGPEQAPAGAGAARPVPGRAQPVPASDVCVPSGREGSGRSSNRLAALAAVSFGAFLHHPRTGHRTGGAVRQQAGGARHRAGRGARRAGRGAGSDGPGGDPPHARMSAPRALAGPARRRRRAAGRRRGPAGHARGGPGPARRGGAAGLPRPRRLGPRRTVVLRERLQPAPALGVTLALTGIVLVATG